MELSPRTEAAGYRLLAVDTAESTNAAALAAVRHGADRLWITAGEQTRGRGRHGRDWASPPGNLYASLGLSLPARAPFAPKLGFVAGVSLAEAIRMTAPASATHLALKWPNDALVGGRKLAGILLEGQSIDADRMAIAIGIGVNVAAFPPELADKAVALTEADPAASAGDLFLALADRMAINLGAFGPEGEGFPAIREAWLRYALAPGERLRIRLPAEEIHGTFAGLDSDGHLEIDTELGRRIVLAGDVFLGDREGE